MNGNPFLKIQGLGRALMLPIAVLPVAGILLRLGQPDVFNIKMIADAGGAIFDNLPLLFAIGVAVGFAKDNNGVAALAGAIGYLIETAIMKDIDPKLNMGVLSGIIAGVVAGLLYNRYKDIKLPDYLAFFGGKRFVPIITGLVCVILGIVFGYVWQPIQHAIDAAGQWLTTAGAIGAFVFGFLNRLLLVTGLHHIINSLAWFVFGNFTPPGGGEIVHGDLHRFFAGDPTAGTFMAGFFPIMMFGLPAACLAMLHEAPKERRAMVGGLLFSMALTSFLTGVTEPIEFSFMFLAPALYALHAVLTGLAMALMNMLGVKLGFGFSAGFLDYALNFTKATRPLLLLPVGLAYFALYYGAFRFAILRFDLKTPGREAEPVGEEIADAPGERGAAFLAALGGAANLTSIDACTTRLRLVVNDQAKVNEARLRSLGAAGVIRPSAQGLQVVLGPIADAVAMEMRAAAGPLSAGHATAIAPSAVVKADAAPWLAALGGRDNVLEAGAATSRIWLRLADPERIDEAALKPLGVRMIARPSDAAVHLIVADAAPIAAALQPA